MQILIGLYQEYKLSDGLTTYEISLDDIDGYKIGANRNKTRNTIACRIFLVFAKKFEVLFYTCLEDERSSKARERLFKKWIKDINAEYVTSFCKIFEIKGGVVLVNVYIDKEKLKLIQSELIDILNPPTDDIITLLA